MALRTIRELGDPVLGKRAKEVREMTPKLRQLIADMKETMYEADGVGLAAPQVGMLKRIVVIDVSEEQNQPLVMINPEIIERDGEQCGWEGCLSVPGKTGQVTRPRHVVARALNENMEDFIVELVEGKLYTNEELDEMIAEEAAKAEAEEAGKE